MSLVSRKSGKIKVIVSFLTAFALFLPSTLVLAAIADKCCKNKQMTCNLINRAALGKKFTPSENRSTQHYDPVTCCDKIFKRQAVVHKKADVDSAVKFTRLPAIAEYTKKEKTTCYHAESGPLLLSSQPLYSLHSTYLI